mgnify:CR=1 FL=1
MKAIRSLSTSNNHPATKVPGEIRIIGGKWRGRKLPVMDSTGLRPTTDRVKETLFNWLMPVISEATCLDCYSGSGALGFEAVSRGAKTAVLLEKSPAIAKQLISNQQKLQADNLSVIAADTLNWLNQPATYQFDVVFIAPPFHQNLVIKTAQLLEENGWLSKEAWIYLETESQYPLTNLPVNWQLHREKQAGQVDYRLFIRQE